MAVQSSNTFCLNKLQHIKFIFGKVHVDELMGGLNPQKHSANPIHSQRASYFLATQEEERATSSGTLLHRRHNDCTRYPVNAKCIVDTIITWHQMTPSRINIVFQSFEGCMLNKQSGYYITCLNTNPVWNTTKTDMKKKLCCFKNKPCPQQNGSPRVINGVLNG